MSGDARIVGLDVRPGVEGEARYISVGYEPPAILTDNELLELYEHETQAREGESDVDALQRCHLEALRRVSERTRLELFREIEGIEAAHPGESVLPHVVGLHLGQCHERDREVAAFTARAIVTVLTPEIDALVGCDGKIDAPDVRRLLGMLHVGGSPETPRADESEPAEAAPAP